MPGCKRICLVLRLEACVCILMVPVWGHADPGGTRMLTPLRFSKFLEIANKRCFSYANQPVQNSHLLHLALTLWATVSLS